MCILIERILNKPIDSNSYVIYVNGQSPCIVIDPGTEDCADLLSFFRSNGLVPEYIFLTHEHFDHIWGVIKLKKLFNCKVYCSSECSQKIIGKKMNLSLFYNQIGFELLPADVIVETIDNVLVWNNKTIEFINTPGHTDGSICISIGSVIFTGDTMIRNTKTVVKFPGGSKTKLIESLSLLNKRLSGRQIQIFPGHGLNYLCNKVNINEFV